MNVSTALVLAALVAAALAVAFSSQRLVPVIAFAAAGIEAVLRFGLVRIDARGLPLALVLAGTLAITGAIVWSRANGKSTVTAAAIVALVGIVQLAALLG